MFSDSAETAHADCPRCGRRGLLGVVDPATGHVMLIRHRTRDVPDRGGVAICNGGRRVDAGDARFIRRDS